MGNVTKSSEPRQSDRTLKSPSPTSTTAAKKTLQPCPQLDLEAPSGAEMILRIVAKVIVLDLELPPGRCAIWHLGLLLLR